MTQETKETRWEQFKDWVSDHYPEVMGAFVATCVGASFGLGFATGGKWTELAIARGLERFHKSGLMKLMDHSGKEVPVDKFVTVLKDTFGD